MLFRSIIYSNQQQFTIMDIKAIKQNLYILSSKLQHQRQALAEDISYDDGHISFLHLSLQVMTSISATSRLSLQARIQQSTSGLRRSVSRSLVAKRVAAGVCRVAGVDEYMISENIGKNNGKGRMVKSGSFVGGLPGKYRLEKVARSRTPVVRRDGRDRLVESLTIKTDNFFACM